MGTFFGRDANLNLTPEQMAVFGLSGLKKGNTTSTSISASTGGDGSASGGEYDPGCKDACKAAYDAFIISWPGKVGKRAAEFQYNRCIEACPKRRPDPSKPPIDKKCPTGQVWDEVQKKCVVQTPEIQGQCGKGAGPAWTGCSPCGKKYWLTTGSCLPGYIPVPKPEGTQCECQKWCQDTGFGDDCMSGEGQNPELGEFKMPPEMMEFYNMLMGRGKEYLERRPGFSAPTMELIQGAGTDKLRAGDAAKRVGMTNALASQGLLGTGAGQAALAGGARETEQGVANLIRDLTVANEAKTTADRESFTGIANQLFGSGADFNKTIEQLNSSRRMEGQSALALYLQYLKMIMDSYAQ